MLLTQALFRREQTVYKISAIAASAAVIALAVGAVHYRFMWHMKQGHEFPTAEALATFCLTIGGIVSFHSFCVFDFSQDSRITLLPQLSSQHAVACPHLVLAYLIVSVKFAVNVHSQLLHCLFLIKV